MIAAYLLAFVLSLLLSLALTWCVRRIALARGWVEGPCLERHVHTLAVPRLGGLGICGALCLVVAAALLAPGAMGLDSPLSARTTLSLLGPAIMVFFLGLYDDFKPLDPYWKFAVQAVAAVLLYLGGFGIHELSLVSGGRMVRSASGLALTVFWVLLITNAFNLIDGLDGLAAGSAMFSTLVVFVVSLIAPNPLVTFLAIALAGAILGFLRYNFHPATIFLGDSGSLFVGFMLSALALAGSQKAPTMVAVGIPVVALGLPILDVALAVARRFLRGKPLFFGDGDHIHHKLLQRGFSQRNAVLVLYAASAAFGFVSLLLLQERRVIALVLAVTGIGVFLGVQQLRYQEVTELISALQRISRRRQVLANHLAVRQAAESLKSRGEFPAICALLQSTLQPMGFDGIRLQKAGSNGISPAALYPLRRKPDGDLLHWWPEGKICEAPWELRLELVTSAQRHWGYLWLIRLCDRGELPLDINVLMADFRSGLADALERASAGWEAQTQDWAEDGEGRARTQAVGSIAD